jgi:hypothetical protein
VHLGLRGNELYVQSGEVLVLVQGLLQQLPPLEDRRVQMMQSLLLHLSVLRRRW